MTLKLIKKLSNIRNNIVWFYFIKYLIMPFYSLTWKYLINFEGRLLYIIFHSYKKIDRNFSLNYSKNDKIIIQNNIELEKISKLINDNIIKKDLLKISNQNLSVGKYDKRENKYKSGSNAYVDDLFENLDDNIKEEIIRFAIKHEIYLSASKYMGVIPVIAKINVLHNITNKTKIPRASMLWHKDDFGYKSLDLFLAINDISENNGPLEFVKKKNPLGVFYKIKSTLNNQDPGQRNKIPESQFTQYFKNDDLGKFTGKPGSGILIDSFSVYHRGGNCLSNYRLVLRISYQTPDSYSLSKRDKSYFIKFLKDEQIYENVLAKYSLTKRSNVLGLINITDILMKFYRIFHYKVI